MVIDKIESLTNNVKNNRQYYITNHKNVIEKDKLQFNKTF